MGALGELWKSDVIRSWGGAPSQARQPILDPGTVGADSKSKATPKPRPLRERSRAELGELAKWPDRAHRAWKKLSFTDQLAVTMQMSAVYGDNFANKFVEFTKSGARIEHSHFGDPFPEYTPDWFAKRGYKLVQKDSVNQWWAHPSGHLMYGKFGAAGTKRAAEIGDQKAFDAARVKLENTIDTLAKLQYRIVNIVQLDDCQHAKDLETVESKAEAALDVAEAIRTKLAAKGVDVSPLDPLVDDLIKLRDWASSELGRMSVDPCADDVAKDRAP